jgi:hypothetical protein
MNKNSFSVFYCAMITGKRKINIYFIVFKAIINTFLKNYYLSVSILINNISIFAWSKKRILKIIC